MERHLGVIFAGDIVGYSRLMERDEAGTLADVRDVFVSLVIPRIEAAGGRLVKEMGDGWLAEFASPVDAVRCAVGLQQALTEREAGKPTDRRLEARIGINLGDIFIEKGDIFGDGVNIAARLEQVADPGGICISGTVFDHLKTNLPVSYRSLGEIRVKNLSHPVRAYRVVTASDGTRASRPDQAPRGRVALALVAAVALGGGALAWWVLRPAPMPVATPVAVPASLAPAMQSDRLARADLPSIAVLPFDNLGGDPAEDYFSDGMTEDLITDLSQISGLFVLARNTTFAYKNRAVDLRQVGRELDVRYIVEGSVRRVGGRVRINAQLIDAMTGGHIWAERYDRDMTDVLGLQDDVVRRIVKALAVKLHPEEQARLERSAQVDPEAYDQLLRGLEQFRRFTPETNRTARTFFERAVAIDPGFARAEADIALTYAMEAEQHWSEDPRETARVALAHGERALQIDPGIAQVHFVLTVIYRTLGQIDASIAAGERAVALDPNYADGYATLASSLAYAGRVDEALEAIAQAVKLNPIRAFFYVWIEGIAHYARGDYARAAELFERVIEANPEFTAGHRMLAATYVELGRPGDAEWAAAEVLATAPHFNVANDARVTNFQDQRVKDRYVAALKAAGLP